MPQHELVDEELDEPSTSEAVARRNIGERRRLESTLVAFVAVSIFLVIAWAVSGAGYFWPGWVIAAFLLVLVLRYARHRRRPVTQQDVDAEIERMHTKGR
jgi:Flp pilus assembly protein TadB